jgi:hypothetical protein
MCNFSADHSAKAQALMNHPAVFNAEQVEQHLQRGALYPSELAAA